MHEIIMGHGQGLEDRIAKTQEAGWHDAATRRVSGMSYNYCEQLAAYNDDGLAGAKACDRVPDADLAPRIRLFVLSRSEEPTSELQSLMLISFSFFFFYLN